MIKLKDRKQKCEECLNKLKSHDTVIGALAIVLMVGVLIMMALDSKADEEVTIIDSSGTITKCYVGVDNVVKCY